VQISLKNVFCYLENGREERKSGPFWRLVALGAGKIKGINEGG
jgi:hypothetical protein